MSFIDSRDRKGGIVGGTKGVRLVDCLPHESQLGIELAPNKELNLPPFHVLDNTANNQAKAGPYFQFLLFIWLFGYPSSQKGVGGSPLLLKSGGRSPGSPISLRWHMRGSSSLPLGGVGNFGSLR